MKISAAAGTCGFDENGKLIPSDALVSLVRSRVGNKLLLGFSGKDSLAMWLFLRENGFEIIPYMFYTVPSLSIDLEMREYYQDFFGTSIYYLPHPLFYDMLRNYRWQPAHRARMMVDFDLPEYDFATVENVLAAENSLGENYLSAIGYLASDNLGRNSFMQRNGTIGEKVRHYYFAIWNWKFKDVMEIIRRYDVKLPRHYEIWGNTGTGRPFEYVGLRAMRQKDHEDYLRVLKWFPLIDLEFFRYEVVSKWEKK